MIESRDTSSGDIVDQPKESSPQAKGLDGGRLNPATPDSLAYLDEFLNSELPIRVMLAEKEIPASHLLKYTRESVILLPEVDSAKLRLELAGVEIATGEVVRVERRLALRIHHVLSAREILKAIPRSSLEEAASKTKELAEELKTKAEEAEEESKTDSLFVIQGDGEEGGSVEQEAEQVQGESIANQAGVIEPSLRKRMDGLFRTEDS